MKIVVLDGYTLNPGDISWEGLEQLGEVVIYDRTPANKVIERINDAEIVYTNKTFISKEIIVACSHLKYIGILATGYNVVDIKTANEKGILVSNVPAYGTEVVGQFAIALLLELCHHIGAHAQAVKEGVWTNSLDFCFWNYPLIELSGKTMGIVGYGRIGQVTGRIAQALGMKILACDKYHNEECITNTCRYVELDELLTDSDVIMLHCSLSAETEGIINKKTIAKMKNGVLVINNSRGQLIVERDLAEALTCKKVAGVGLDVVSIEPIESSNPLLSAPNVIITPHISWASRESRQRLMDCTIQNLRSFINGKPSNIVNL